MSDDSGRTGGAGPRVTFYTRPGCHLCDEARVVLDAVCAEEGEEFVEISIAGDAELEARFGNEIPVTFVDGRQHDFWRVSATRLRSALRDA